MMKATAPRSSALNAPPPAQDPTKSREVSPQELALAKKHGCLSSSANTVRCISPFPRPRPAPLSCWSPWCPECRPPAPPCVPQKAHVTEFLLLFEVAEAQPGADVSALEDVRRTVTGAAVGHKAALAAPRVEAGRPRAPVAASRFPSFAGGVALPP